MITGIKTIKEIEPIFKTYLNHMRQFFEIVHYEPWCKRALKNLQHYLKSDDQHIFIIKESDIIIGFAMVNNHLRFNTDGFAVAEFYVQKAYQRKGYGRMLTDHIFAAFPGNWEVAVAFKNNSALAFWGQIVSLYEKNKCIKKSSFNGYGFVFNNGR